MTTLLPVLGLLLALQDPPVGLAPGEPEPNRWPLTAVAKFPDGTVLRVTVSRIERRWVEGRKIFRSSAEDSPAMRTAGEVRQGRFQADVPAGPSGAYQWTLRRDSEELGSGSFLLGRLSGWTEAAKRGIPKLLEAHRGVLRLLDEVRGLGKERKPPDPETWAKFLSKAQRPYEMLEQEKEVSDFSATIEILREACFALLNLQGGEQGAEPEDSIAPGEPRFLEEGVTVDSLQRRVESVPSVLSAEAGVGAAEWMKEAVHRPGKNGARRQAVAHALLPVLEAVPMRDERLEALLRSAAENKEETTAGLLRSLEEYLASRVTGSSPD